MIELPKCRYCGNAWMPSHGVIASNSYCAKCRKTRRREAKKVLGLRRIKKADVKGTHLLTPAMSRLWQTKGS